jgi:hypothetical protein
VHQASQSGTATGRDQATPGSACGGSSRLPRDQEIAASAVHHRAAWRGTALVEYTIVFSRST